MPSQTEEQQAQEFLKRAEIRTMRKDLRSLREVDAVKERDKIAKLKTLEEQLQEIKTKQAAESASQAAEKAGMEEILQRNEGQERIAEKDLKSYATEQERQQIFLLESQRLNLEKQIDAIDKEKDPALKLEKNKILIEERKRKEKLNSILDQEKKLEDEQKFIQDKSQTTAIASEKKSLEQRRAELDKEIQEIEKRRWEAEKQIQDLDSKLTEVDKSSEQLVTEKNSLRDKVLGADKSLREIYSGVMAREEEKRRGEAQEQVVKKEALAKFRAAEKEKIQRQQWSKGTPSMQNKTEVPVPVKKSFAKATEAEEEQRKKFLQNVETATNKNQGQPQQKSNIK